MVGARRCDGGLESLQPSANSFRSISEGRESSVEKPKGKGTIATTFGCDEHSPTMARHGASEGPKGSRGSLSVATHSPRGEHEQLVSREDLGLILGCWETFWRTSGGAKAQTVLGVKAQNANPTPPEVAWRIRIGNGHFGGDTKDPAGADFILREFFRTGLAGRTYTT